MHNILCCIYRNILPARRNTPKILAKGLYPGAEVVRGVNWNLEERDGRLKPLKCIGANNNFCHDYLL